MSKVVALCVADLHLSWNPPVARSAEPDWLESQARPLRQLEELQEKYDCPVIVVGDVFDKYNPSPALINWAIQHLPTIIAVAGQHDLPLHNLSDLKKSAFWTLMEANVILPHDDVDFCLWRFPFGEQIIPPENWEGSRGLKVAVAHSYIWTEGNHYIGSSTKTYLASYAEQLKGYDVAVFGDNHCGFDSSIRGGCEIYNCGCLIRRKRDERMLRPAVGLLWDTGKVQRHFLDVSEDKWLDDDEGLPLGELDESNLAEFLDELGGLDTERVGFRDMVRRYVADGEASEGVGKVMLLALEGE